MVAFPTYLELHQAVAAELVTGAQYGHPEESGARTGDVSMKMIKEVGCTYVLCGHSERRSGHHETNEQVTQQVIAALEAGLHPIVCIGETEKERDAGKDKTVIKEQMKGLPTESDLTIAYEPVWAIGTGKTATPEQAEEMHAYIRSLLPADKQESTRILYGGSLKAINAHMLFAQPNIDGGLVGGASLKPDEFKDIIDSALDIEK